jgi:hypothetical protein
MREAPPLKTLSQQSHLSCLQWPLLHPDSAVTLPHTSVVGVLPPPPPPAGDADGMTVISGT